MNQKRTYIGGKMWASGYPDPDQRSSTSISNSASKGKEPIYPSFRVGDIVKVKGRLNEWSRRDGRVVRELNCPSGDGGFGEFVWLPFLSVATLNGSLPVPIAITNPVEEALYIDRVRVLHQDVYNRPFKIPPPQPLLRLIDGNGSTRTDGVSPSKNKSTSNPALGSPAKKRRIEMEPSSEAEADGTMGMSSSVGVGGYGDRVSGTFVLDRGRAR
jgi:hypothetical protein